MLEVRIGHVRSWQLRKNYQNMLDLVEYKAVRWDRGGNELAHEYIV
jgi:hypothetical protein